MEFSFKTYKKIVTILDIILVPALIYLIIEGNNTIAEWIVLALANAFMIYGMIKNKKDNRNDYYNSNDRNNNNNNNNSNLYY